MQNVLLVSGQQKNKMPAHLKFWKIKNIDFPEIAQSRLKRDWMDKTYNKLAYLCTPLSNATVHGWEIKLPHDVKVIWDGKWEGVDGEDSNHVKILEGERYKDNLIATNQSGVRQISFLLNTLVETDEDHYLLISGPPNFIFEDAYPLSVVWRSDFYNYQEVSLSWKILTPNKEIIFPKGMPIAFITVYPKNLLESTEVEIDLLDNNKDLSENLKKYADKRAEILKNDPYKFPQLYKHGIGPNKEKFLEKPWKIVLKDPKKLY